MNGQAIFVGALLMTLVEFLVLLVTNPKAFIELHKSQREHDKERADRVGKAVNGAASIAAKLLKRK